MKVTSSKPPRHLVLVANSAANLAHFRRPLWEALLRQGYTLGALAPAGEGEELLRAHGIAFHPLRWLAPTGLNPFQDLRLANELRQWYTRLRPAAVLHFTAKPNIWGSWAARRAGIPGIANFTGLGAGMLHGKLAAGLQLRLYRWAVRDASAAVVQNEDDAQVLRAAGVAPQRWVQIPGSGIDTNHYPATPLPAGEGKVFLYLGRMLRDKGLHELAQAWQTSGLAAQGHQLHLAGPFDPTHPASVSVQRWQSWMALPGWRYLGELADVRPALAAAHVLVLPSYREGMPRAALEALSMERPLVATDVPGCRALAQPGITGWRVAPRRVDELAQALVQAATLPLDELARLGRQGRRLVLAHYAQAHIQDAYLQLLDEILGQAAPI